MLLRHPFDALRPLKRSDNERLPLLSGAAQVAPSIPNVPPMLAFDTALPPARSTKDSSNEARKALLQMTNTKISNDFVTFACPRTGKVPPRPKWRARKNKSFTLPSNRRLEVPALERTCPCSFNRIPLNSFPHDLRPVFAIVPWPQTFIEQSALNANTTPVRSFKETLIHS